MNAHRPGPSRRAVALNCDELGPDPLCGMDLAVQLGMGLIEFRSAYGNNALTLTAGQLTTIRRQAHDRGLTIAALASPLWKWCRPEASPGDVDTFGFPARVPQEARRGWVDAAISAATILEAPIVRVFSHLRVAELTDNFTEDPLLTYALERAAQAGVRLALENEPICTIADVESLVTVSRRYSDLGLRLWLDVANLYEVGQACVETIRALAPHVDYVQIKGYQRNPQGQKVFCAAGSGEVPYRILLPHLLITCPDVPYALESHVLDTPAKALTMGASFLESAFVEANTMAQLTGPWAGAGERGSRG